jgi:hypothetical protein
MRESIWTPEKESAFFIALAETCNVSKACAAVDISRQTAYSRRENDEAFAKAWDKALTIAVGALEDEVHRRAFEGVEEPVFNKGVRVGSIRRYSDTLAIFLLKAHAPAKYRERYEVTGAGGQALIPSHGESVLETAKRLAYLMNTAAEQVDSETRALEKPPVRETADSVDD